jgi:DNA excision repair protein ERCC-2
LPIRVDHKTQEISISVRDLAYYRTPRIIPPSISFKNAEKGREVHQSVQTEKLERNPEYQAEYYVKTSFIRKNWTITLRGRIDLVVQTSTSIQLEEIKSFYSKEFEGSITDPMIGAYLKQLQIYAWVFKKSEMPKFPLKLILILVNRFDDSKYSLNVSNIDMEKEIFQKIDLLIEKEIYRHAQHQKKIESLEKFTFPFPYRPFQKEIISEINQVVEEELALMIEAPSGLGKTVVSLYPLLSCAIQENRKLFFLTAKSTQRRIVEETLNIFHQQGIQFIALFLKAKEKMCPNTVYFCHEDYCEWLDNYSHNYPEHVLKTFIEQKGIVTPEEIISVASETKAFCPFELALDLSLESDIIIGDYNYVFHPRVVLQRFFGNHIPKSLKYYLIIDEAHNLVNRSLDYYSHSLSQIDVSKLKRDISLLEKKYQGLPTPEFLIPILERIFRILRSNYGISPSTHLLTSLDTASLDSILLRLEEQIPIYLRFLFENNLHWPNDPIIWFYYDFREFTETAKLAQEAEEFSIIYNSQEGSIKILCKDASPFLNKQFDFFKSIIAISATMTPFTFYRDLLGFPIEKTLFRKYPSPFPPENRLILVESNINTRYKQRNEYYEEIAGLISNTVRIKPGRYFAFFPSFKFASEVIKHFKPTSKFKIIKQLGPMHDEERQKFIDQLESNPYVLAIAVTAGIFAEGIDFPGMLDGVFVISPSLPTYSFERELIRQFFEERYSNGFAYAYQFPGLTRTFQAAGRLIRTASDKGIVIFIGQRFASRSYAEFFPSYYFKNSPSELISQDILKDVRTFWKKQEDN